MQYIKKNVEYQRKTVKDDIATGGHDTYKKIPFDTLAADQNGVRALDYKQLLHYANPEMFYLDIGHKPKARNRDFTYRFLALSPSKIIMCTLSVAPWRWKCSS